MTLDGAEVRQRRTALGLTQVAVAELSSLALRTVQHAEAGRRVAQDSARRLCSALGAPYVALLRPTLVVVQSRLLEAGYGPPPPPSPWAGRETVTERLVEQIRDRQPVTCCIAGVSGIGKTALAQRVVAAVGRQFRDGVVWVSAPADGAHAAAIQLEVAEALGFEARMPNPEMVGTEALHAAFQARLWSRERLLVLDDVDTASMLARFIGRSPGCALVTTARRQLTERVEGPVVELGGLDEGAGRHLIELHIGEARSASDPEGIRRVAELVGYVPRGLQIAGRVLGDERYTRPSDYATRLAESLEQGDAARVGPWVEPDDPDASFAASHAQLRGRLSSDAWAALGALSVMEGQAFPLEWATAVLGLAEPNARRLLSELSDFYLVQEARQTGEGTWFRLDAQAQRVARWVGRKGAREATRRLLSHACRRAEALAARPAEDVLQAYHRQAGLWRVCLQRAATEAVLELPARPPSSPDELPEPAGTVLPEVQLLLRILWSFRALFMMKPHPDGWQWLASGLALARATRNHVAYGRLAELMAWWLVLTLIDTRGAEVWYRESEAAYRRAHRADDVARMALMVGQAAWAVHGPSQATPLYRRALDRCAEEGVPAWRKAAAVKGMAMSLLAGQRDDESVPAVIDLFDEAASLCARDGIGRIGPARTIWAACVMNAALLRQLTQQPDDPEAVLEAWAELRSLRLDDDLGVFLVDTTAARLGHTDTASTNDQQRRRILLGAPPELVWRRVILLLATVAYLGETPEGMADGVRGGFVVGHSPLGVTDIVLCLPSGLEIGHGVPLLHPLEPLCALLDDAGLSLAMRYVEGVCGPGHPLDLALHAAAEQRGLNDPKDVFVSS